MLNHSKNQNILAQNAKNHARIGLLQLPPLRIEYPGVMYHVMNLGESTPECVQEKSGHLFQGRYKAQLVESEEYISKLSRYIHLNPVGVKK